jgi:uncharacterized protein
MAERSGRRGRIKLVDEPHKLFSDGGVVIVGMLGATLITFPAMLAAGLPPVVANASNAVAVSPGCFVAAFADRHALPPAGGRMVIATLCALLGGATGVALLLVTPEQLFTLLVRALVGVATGIFAFAESLQRTITRAFGAAALQGAALRVGLLVPTAVYGGYFGAGLGVMLLAALTATGREDLRAANALKNLLAATVSVVTIPIFVSRDLVRWPEAL